MKTSDFYYELPSELIAQSPSVERDQSRLLVLRADGTNDHRLFRDIKEYLRPGDCLVLNDTKVLPVRLLGQKVSGAECEVFLLKRRSADEWVCMVRPGKRLKPGAEVIFSPKLRAAIVSEEEDGLRLVRFSFEGVFEEVLDEVGHVPLPPYIQADLKDPSRYNTVYAKFDGSTAAPTAGLHFTEVLLDELKEMGVRIARVTLHVGLGTFRPVQVERIEDHFMHTEWFEIREADAALINQIKSSGEGRIIAVGTTSCRALESAAYATYMGENSEPQDKCDHGFTQKSFRVKSASMDTNIFIYPGYVFKIVDCLITNFHLPESTLVMLVSALAGRERILSAYNEAIAERYRFFSFGDAMYIEATKPRECLRDSKAETVEMQGREA